MCIRDRLRGVAGKTKMTETLNQRLLLPVMKLVAPIIRLDDFKERRMKINLELAGIIFTPKEYYARAVVIDVYKRQKLHIDKHLTNRREGRKIIWILNRNLK